MSSISRIAKSSYLLCNKNLPQPPAESPLLGERSPSEGFRHYFLTSKHRPNQTVVAHALGPGRNCVGSQPLPGLHVCSQAYHSRAGATCALTSLLPPWHRAVLLRPYGKHGKIRMATAALLARRTGPRLRCLPPAFFFFCLARLKRAPVTKKSKRETRS